MLKWSCASYRSSRLTPITGLWSDSRAQSRLAMVCRCVTSLHTIEIQHCLRLRTVLRHRHTKVLPPRRSFRSIAIRACDESFGIYSFAGNCTLLHFRISLWTAVSLHTVAQCRSTHCQQYTCGSLRKCMWSCRDRTIGLGCGSHLG